MPLCAPSSGAESLENRDTRPDNNVRDALVSAPHQFSADDVTFDGLPPSLANVSSSDRSVAVPSAQMCKSFADRGIVLHRFRHEGQRCRRRLKNDPERPGDKGSIFGRR